MEESGGPAVYYAIYGYMEFSRVHTWQAGDAVWFLACLCLLSLLEGRAVAEEHPKQEALDRQSILAGPLSGIDEIVFAVRKPGPDGHWYANFSYYAENEERLTYREGGRLCRLNLATGDVTTLLDAPRGGVRDPAVHYSGKRILFSYREGGGNNYHLWEIDSDGSNLRQLTKGSYDDIEPCYLPDGGIVFVSSRAKRWVNCWLTQVATLHRSDGDGRNIRMISANVEHDNTPWVLPDGRVLYQRWEYVDRSQVHYHHLWTALPDGTQQMVYYGNQQPGIVMIDAKPVPGTNKVVSIFSPGHGRREHAGAVVLVNPEAGPDDRSSVRTIHGEADFRDPWAFSTTAFLVARGHEILFMNARGETSTIFSLGPSERQSGFECHEPRPLTARERERVVPGRVRTGRTVGHLILTDVTRGRNMAGVKPGEIKRLLVLESLPKPINYTGGMDPLTYGGSFTLERVLGTVPVEPDGSAYMELPALRSLFFVALDANDLSVKRMQSFLTVQPGEVTSCVGCHEQRTQTVPPTDRLLALRRPPSPVEPVADCPDVLDFPRDVQPIIDRLCVDCHGYERTERGGPYAGKLILTGDRGPMFSHAYYTMTVHRLFSDGRNRPVSNHAPRSIGSSASRILRMLDGSHYGVEATDHEKKVLRLWIEVGAPYPGTYAALGTGMIGGYHQNRQVHTDRDWPAARSAGEVIDRRCGSCHHGSRVLPRSLSDECGLSFWKPSWSDPRLKRSRHIVFNLSRPEKSLILLAPLAGAAGGWELCRQPDGDEDGPQNEALPVFTSSDDPDYQRLLTLCRAGKENLERIKRFDMPDFVPHPAYVREMKRYGVLEAAHPPDVPLNPYALDRAYWESLWYRPH